MIHARGESSIVGLDRSLFIFSKYSSLPSSKVYCLAFAALDDPFAIFGDAQPRTCTVVFIDRKKERIGFSLGSCN
jgi:hypothetical protein